MIFKVGHSNLSEYSLVVGSNLMVHSFAFAFAHYPIVDQDDSEKPACVKFIVLRKTDVSFLILQARGDKES